MKVYQEVNEQFETNPVNAVDHHNTSKYRQADSRQIINVLESKGFNHVATSIAQVRDVKKLGKQKHIMIFERPDLLIDNGNKLRLLVTNSHDGSSSLQINIGIFRVVCANGLVAGESFFQERIKHVGSEFYTKLRIAIDKAVIAAPKLAHTVRLMQATELSSDNQFKLADQVAPCLDKDLFNAQLLKVNRVGDNFNDLYTVLNRIQENVIRGGVRYITEDKAGNDIIRTTRAVKSIDKSRKLNQYVWDKCINFLNEAA